MGYIDIFDSSVTGIPCKIGIKPDPLALFGEKPDYEFDVLDTKGRRSHWLESRMAAACVEKIKADLHDAIEQSWPA